MNPRGSRTPITATNRNIRSKRWQNASSVRVICDCGAVREIEPEALARLVGWKMTLKELAQRMRCQRLFRVLPNRPRALWPHGSVSPRRVVYARDM